MHSICESIQKDLSFIFCMGIWHLPQNTICNNHSFLHTKLWVCIQKLLIVLGTVLIHLVIEPIISYLFTLIKNKIKSKQKTPENDGELADKMLEKVEELEDKVEDKLNGRNKK